MLSDISDTQLQLDEEYQLSSEQILMENQMILKSLNEIKRKLEDFDARLTYFEQQQQQQQQKHMTFTSSQKDLPDYNLEEKTNSDIVLEKSIKKEKQRSTCFSCRWEKKTCTLYFEDLYDFDKREINSDIGADSNRFTCRCGHLIRIHEYRTNSSERKLPPFANPPLRQLLYEELVPPIIQNWIWSFRTNKSNEVHQSNNVNKED